MKKLATSKYLGNKISNTIDLVKLKILYFMYVDLLSQQQKFHRYKDRIFYDL